MKILLLLFILSVPASQCYSLDLVKLSHRLTTECGTTSSILIKKLILMLYRGESSADIFCDKTEVINMLATCPNSSNDTLCPDFLSIFRDEQDKAKGVIIGN